MPPSASSRRGTWRAVYTALFDDSDYQRLSAHARLLLLTLRLGPLNNAVSIFPFYAEAIQKQAGLSTTEFSAALHELTTSKPPWVFVDDDVVWIRNGLRFDPSVSLENPNHLPWIDRIIGGLPRCELVKKFLRYYNLHKPSHRRSHRPSDRASHAASDAGGGGGSTSPTPIPIPIPNTNQNTSLKLPPPPPASAAPISPHSLRNERGNYPAEYYNTCGEGRAGRCVKTEYLSQVAGAVQCDTHERQSATTMKSLERVPPRAR